MAADSVLPQVLCPICRKPVPWSAEQKFKPFCSERCQLIDLGDWATEAYKIPVKDYSEPGLEDDDLKLS